MTKTWIACLLGLLLLGSASAFAEDDESPLGVPQVLEKGDTLVGVRLSQGGVYDGQPIVGLAGEHMITPMIGVGGSLAYTTYENRYEFSTFKAEWDYKVYSLIVQGNYHADLFRVPNLDTYGSFGLGHTFVSSKWKTNAAVDPVTKADASQTFFVVYLNARYFLNPHWGLTGSIGTGVGTLVVGADYRF